MSDPTTVTRNSEERSPSLFVQALNEDAQAVFMGCPGREFILTEYLPRANSPHWVPKSLVRFKNPNLLTPNLKLKSNQAHFKPRSELYNVSDDIFNYL